MALNENVLAKEFKRILTSNPAVNGETGIEYFSQQMAAAVINHIRSYGEIMVIVDPGIPVNVGGAGGATIGTGSGRGKIS